MSRFKVLITDRFDVDAQAFLKTHPKLEVSRSTGPLPTSHELSGINALIIRSRTKVDEALLSQARDLKVIVTATSGFDHIDLEATQKHDVKVMYTPSANAASAAELTWMLVLACSRRAIEAHRAVKTGDWKRESLIGREIAGGTYGIIGLGRIGSKVARFANAFDMQVVAFDPYCENEAFVRAGAQRVSLDELMRISDVVSVHVPSTEETEKMITPLLLESMSRSAIFVNASRGSVVSERTLIQALNEKWVAAIGLDVFEREPLARDSKLMTFDNVVMTPHLGATTTQAFAAASREAAQKIASFVELGEIQDPLPPEEAWYQSSFAKNPAQD